jgi:hypothetical protein
MPVVVTRPPGVCRPNLCVAASSSPQSTPPRRPHRPRRGIDVDLLQAGEVDHDPALAEAQPGDAVPSGAHRDLELVLAGKVEGDRHVGGRPTAGNQRRPPVDHGVENLPSLVVNGVARDDQLSGKNLAQLVERSASVHVSSSRWFRSLQTIHQRGAADYGPDPRRAFSVRPCFAA